jgi:SAM-dependent methyltransferase
MSTCHPLRQPDYLAAVQYSTSKNLADRSYLHDHYSTRSLPFRAWEVGLIDWPVDAAVLEVGAGPGRFWEDERLPRTLQVTATDLSPGMVAQADDAIAAWGYSSVRTLVCDAQHLPFDDDQFDVIVANHMLYHVPEPEQALREFRRLLRPGGTALIATNAPGHMRQMNDALAEVFGETPLALNDVFGIDNGELMLREVATSVTWHSFVNPLIVDDVEALMRYATSLPPAQFGSPEQISQLRDNFQKGIVDGGGTLRIDTRTGAFVCSF